MAAPAIPLPLPLPLAPRQPKRKRAADDTGSPAAAPPLEPSSKKARLGESLSLGSQGDISIFDALEARYDVQLHGVVSSSKIQKRVSAILRHIGGPRPRPDTGGDSFPGDAAASTAPTAPTAPTTTTRPRISVLRARAADAGKLITIAEIAKRELEKQGRGDTADADADAAGRPRRWFQYIALGEEIRERPRGDDRSIVEDTVLGGARARATITQDKSNKDGEEEGEEDNDDNDDDDDKNVETIKTPLERAIEGRPLVRGTPVMSLFLSRVSIDELRKRYGEQTNAPPT